MDQLDNLTDEEQEGSYSISTPENDRPRDLNANAGLASTKLWMGIGTALAISLGGLYYAHSEAFRSAYQMFISGLMGTYALFCGSNITNKFVVGKHQIAREALDSDPPQPSSGRLTRRSIEPLPPDVSSD